MGEQCRQQSFQMRALVCRLIAKYDEASEVTQGMFERNATLTAVCVGHEDRIQVNPLITL